MPRPTTKESIIEYCKEDGIDCIDTSSKNPHHEWSLNLNKVIIYCQKKYPHRIYVQVNISFGELVPIFNTKENKGKLMTLLKMFALSNDFNLGFAYDDKKNVNRIIAFKVHYNSTIKKADFLPLYSRVGNILDMLYIQLQNVGNVENKKIQDQQKASDENPLAT